MQCVIPRGRGLNGKPFVQHFGKGLIAVKKQLERFVPLHRPAVAERAKRRHPVCHALRVGKHQEGCRGRVVRVACHQQSERYCLQPPQPFGVG